MCVYILQIYYIVLGIKASTHRLGPRRAAGATGRATPARRAARGIVLNDVFTTFFLLYDTIHTDLDIAELLECSLVYSETRTQGLFIRYAAKTARPVFLLTNSVLSFLYQVHTLVAGTKYALQLRLPGYDWSTPIEIDPKGSGSDRNEMVRLR